MYRSAAGEAEVRERSNASHAWDAGRTLVKYRRWSRLVNRWSNSVKNGRLWSITGQTRSKTVNFGQSLVKLGQTRSTLVNHWSNSVNNGQLRSITGQTHHWSNSSLVKPITGQTRSVVEHAPVKHRSSAGDKWSNTGIIKRSNNGQTPAKQGPGTLKTGQEPVEHGQIPV